MKSEATLFLGMIGRLSDTKQYISNSVSAAMLARDWSEGHARVFACWIAGATAGAVDTKGMCLVVAVPNLLTFEIL